MENKTSIVYTNKAKCRDCYRCVRVCPVNAIKMEKGQANVIPENCISCGSCIPECPQNAKTYVKNTEQVLEYFSQGKKVIISIAPSFASVYTLWERKRLASALRQAGFSVITETAIAAHHVAHQTRQLIEQNPDKTHICTACPAVVNFIEKYSHSEINNLTPIVSPMLAHGRMLKKKYGEDCKVVFAGPCVAKKEEAIHPENKKFVDAVLTFSELNEILEHQKVNLKACEESSFDEEAVGMSRLFPLEEGLLKTAKINEEFISSNKFFAISGFSEVKDALDTVKQNNGDYVIEPLFCSSGCINGPVLRENSLLKRRQELINYFDEKKNNGKTEEINEDLSFNFSKSATLNETVFSESQIYEVLKSTGKTSKEEELNCRACGYDTCRDKAIAVLQGIAEKEMCMPYMRRLAEQKNDQLIAADPNGIVILNNQLEIINMNPAFKKMFVGSDSLIGKKASILFDPEPFEQIITQKVSKFSDIVKYPNYNLVCHLLCYAIEEAQQYVGIFVDITDVHFNKEKLRDLKTETILQAQELMEHQVNMAQELAKFIGDHTARGEMLMNKLIKEITK